MEDKINIVSYFRKGLSQYIETGQKDQKGQNENQSEKDPSRASIELTIKMEGTKPSGQPDYFDASRTLRLVGPGDIKQVKPAIISQIYPPAINTQRFNPTTMPFVEFYEADFPWRYTPLPVNDVNENNKICIPWLVLVAVNEDEYKLVMDKGKKKVEFNLSEERYNKVFPAESLFPKLAHVQVVEAGDEEGIARLLCASELENDQHITVFLLPAFETGRLSGLNQKYDEVAIDDRSWSWEKKKTVFPVYYHWSFYSGDQSGTFEELANKLEMAPEEAYDSMQANLTVDIAESGLDNEEVLQDYRDKKEEFPIDVRVALIPGLGEQKDKKLREEPLGYKVALKNELSLSPVFTENTTGHPVTNEDPWVVPPVYGARHLLSKDLDGDGVVPQVNLTLRHRIAAGMGASAVKENQESFVHRAWQKVEKINELNQKLREYYQMKEVEQKAENRLKTEKGSIKELRDKVVKGTLTKSRYALLTSDSLRRTLTSTKLARKSITVGQVRKVVSDNMQPVEKVERIIGITPEELGALFNWQTWDRIVNPEEYNQDNTEDNTVNKIKDDFKTMVANEHIEQYKNNNGWLQYLINPYYNIGTNPNYRDICCIKPVDNPFVPQPYLFSPECTDLLNWIAGWGFDTVADAAHSFDYYYRASKDYNKQRSWFDPVYYNADFKSPIEQVVYPLKLSVKVGDEEYNGYVMDANLFSSFCNAFFGEGVEKKDYLAFEYHLTNDQGQVIGKKGYTFLFPSDYSGMEYHKHIHFSINGNAMIVDQNFKYKDGECKRESDRVGIFGFFHSIKTPDYKNPFTNRQFFDEMDDFVKKFKKNPKNYKIEYDSKRPDLVYVRFVYDKGPERKLYFERHDMGIPQSGEFDSDAIDKKEFAKWLSYRYQEFKDNVDILRQRWMLTPDTANVVFDKSINYNFLVSQLPSKLDLSMDQDKKIMLYEQLIERLKEGDFNTKNGIIPQPVPAAPEPASSLPDLEKETQDTITTLLGKYGYTEEGQLNEIKKKGLTKYPVMIYPEYLDPTYYYLRELSPNYVVPSAGELNNNSVTLFESNAEFEEAFLMGMNTEMGQELLWREYPTDQRGSYFRKFWKASNPPSKEQLRTTYFDIKEVSDWTDRLSKNHAENKKSGMLVFAIKGELMQAYPRTSVYLTSYSDQTLYIMAKADMTSWLTEDTYLVGFEGRKADEVKGFYLTFQEEVTSLQFEKGDDYENKVASAQNSAELAKELINTPSVFLLPINNN